jgi:hypothetical protein
MAMSRSSVSSRYALGARHWDLTTCAALALVAIVASLGLRVYYRVTLVEVALVRVDPNGAQHVLPVPEAVWGPAQRSQAARRQPAEMLRTLEAQIGEFMATAPLAAAAPVGARFEWRIRYSENSLRLDRKAVVAFGARAGARW